MNNDNSKYEVAYKIANDLNLLELALKSVNAPIKDNKHYIETKEQLDKAIEFYSIRMQKILFYLR